MVDQQLDKELVVVLAEKRVRRRRLAKHSHQQLIALVGLERFAQQVVDVLDSKRDADDRVEFGESLLQELLQEVPLAVEVEVEGAMGDVGAAGDVVSRGVRGPLSVQPTLGERKN